MFLLQIEELLTTVAVPHVQQVSGAPSHELLLLRACGTNGLQRRSARRLRRIFRLQIEVLLTAVAVPQVKDVLLAPSHELLPL